MALSANCSGSATVQRSAPRAFDAPLTQAMLDIAQKNRANWFPWRGQFSPQLVEAFLTEYATADMCVYDPFMGSGTVLAEAARRGMPAIGVEINPAAYWLARVYSLCRLDTPAKVQLIASFERKVRQFIAHAEGQVELFSTRTAPSVTLRGLIQAISPQNDEEETLLAALAVLLEKPTCEGHELLRQWQRLRTVLLQMPVCVAPIIPILGDARRTEIPDCQVDFVLTSPPYINVLNYHHHFRAVIESLGWDALSVARSEIGANRKFRQNRFLTVVQYCIDMALALSEIRRVCKPSAKIAVVIGRVSQVHKTPFCNSQILLQLASEIAGLKAVLTQQRSYQNRFGERIVEDILHLTLEPHAYIHSVPERVEAARAIARNVLLEAEPLVPEERRRYLHDALDRLPSVVPSPIFTGEARR